MAVRRKLSRISGYKRKKKGHGPLQENNRRRSIPLSNFRAECAMCHANFPAGPTPDWVGALMLRVPVK